MSKLDYVPNYATRQMDVYRYGDNRERVAFVKSFHTEDAALAYCMMANPDEPEPSTQGYHLIDGILHRCPIWDGAEACAHCERLDTPPDLSYQATFERAIRVEDY